MEKRTLKQNRSLWKYYEMLANELSLSGYDMKKVLRPEIEIPWTKESVHSFLWLPIQEAMYGTDSTTELTTKQINDVYEVLTRHLGEKLGIEATPFPAIEEK